MTAQIVADVLLKTDGVTRGVSQVQGKLRGLASSTGSVFKGVLGANLVGKALDVAGAGLSKFTGLLGDSITEARESEVVGKTTAQIIKATGGAAKVSAGQVGDLATALSNKTGVDDEAIQQGSNLLLTFKNVRNEAGRGAKIFDRATAASVDLSKAGFGSIDSASKMLGKALNDPEKGLTALGRAGVTFSDKQKDTIKSMVQTGDVLGAQKLILKEVESQVGGVAAANATAGEKAKVMASNLKEQFGTALLPLLDRAASFFTSTLGPAISRGIEQVGPALDKVASMVGPAFNRIVAFVGPLVAQVRATLAGLFAGGGGLQGFLAQVQPLGAALLSVFAGVRAVIVALLPIVAQVIGAVIAGVRSVLPQLTSAYQAVASTLQSVASILTSVWKAIGPIVLPIVTSVFGTIITVVSGALNIIAGIFKTIAAVLKGDWSGAWDGIKQIVSGAWTIIKAVVSGAAAVTRTLMAGLGKAIAAQWTAAWNNVKAIVSAAWSKIKAAISAGISAAKSVVSAGINAVKSTMTAGWNAVKSGVTTAWNTIRSSVTSGIARVVSLVRAVPGKLRAAISGSLFGAGSRLIGTLVSGIRARISDAVAAVRAGVQRIRNLLPGSPIKDGPLKSWNNGGAGKRLMALLAGGIRAESSSVQTAMEDALQPPRVNLTTALRSASAASRAAAGGASAAPTTIHVRLEVPVGASGVDIGRELVSYLRQYSSATGQRIVVS